MNPLVIQGRKKTIFISISILIVAIHTIYYYNVHQPEVETKKIVQQVIRFLLTVGLLILLYKGVKWAKIVALILFGLGAILALIGIFMLGGGMAPKIPLIVMIFVYVMAVYHFGFSKEYKAFSNYQNLTKQKL
jgi:hypothetical protein